MSNPQMSVFANNDAHFIIHRDPRGRGPAVLYLDMSDSSPIQGRFETDSSAEAALRNLEPHERARLGTLFLELEAAGNRPSTITVQLIDKAKARTPTPVVERAERLLRFLHDETSQIGETLEYQHGDPRPRLYSESIDDSETHFLLESLAQQDLVADYSALGIFGAKLTVHGFAHVAQQAAAPDSSQAFVAQWFDPSMEALYEDGIGPGVRAAGYEPVRVDRQPTLHRIDDQIIAEIRRSRFIVADFTQGGGGARGSVYYEAGFAQGLGLPVIFTCREDQLDDLHFDTRQYPHIGWNDPADLRDKLAYRIEALIGAGPKTGAG